MASATALPRRSLILFDHLCVFPRKRLSASEIQLSSRLFFFLFFFPFGKSFVDNRIVRSTFRIEL